MHLVSASRTADSELKSFPNVIYAICKNLTNNADMLVNELSIGNTRGIIIDFPIILCPVMDLNDGNILTTASDDHVTLNKYVSQEGTLDSNFSKGLRQASFYHS